MRVIQSVALVCALLVANVFAKDKFWTCKGQADKFSYTCNEGYKLDKNQECGPGSDFSCRQVEQGQLRHADKKGEGCCYKQYQWTCGDQADKFDLTCKADYTLDSKAMCGPGESFSCRQKGQMRHNAKKGKGCCIRNDRNCKELECDAGYTAQDLLCGPNTAVRCFEGNGRTSHDDGSNDKPACCVPVSP